jgi:hypothetical protein
MTDIETPVSLALAPIEAFSKLLLQHDHVDDSPIDAYDCGLVLESLHKQASRELLKGIEEDQLPEDPLQLSAEDQEKSRQLGADINLVMNALEKDRPRLAQFAGSIMDDIPIFPPE